MFKYIFQKQWILSRFLCALLCLHPEDIHSIQILNPIIPGENTQEKLENTQDKLMNKEQTIISLQEEIKKLRLELEKKESIPSALPGKEPD